MDYRQEDSRRRDWSRGDEFYGRTEEGRREFDRRPEERGGVTGESWGGWSRQAGSPSAYYLEYSAIRGVPRGRFTGRGPRNYQRSDERIREDVNERLAENPDLDATDIEVKVSEREVTLEGKVEDRAAKRLAEDLAEAVPGVKDVHNHLKVNEGFFARLFGTDEEDRHREERERAL